MLPRKSVLALSPFKPQSEGRYGRTRLDFNENTAGFPQCYPQDMPAELVSAYPEYKQLIEKLCRHYQVPAECLILTNGSDEGIFLLATTFIEPGIDTAVISQPCFIVMPHYLTLAGATVQAVPVKPDFSFDCTGIEAKLAAGAKLAMFASPENPTGQILPVDVIEGWCRKFPDTLFVIDEAYGEYAEASMLSHSCTQANLIVLRTFSKVWGMAGLRLGLMFGEPSVLDYVRRVKLPFSVNSAAVWTALRLLEQPEAVQSAAQEALEYKCALESQLSQRGYEIVSGASNSLLLQLGANASTFVDFAAQGNLLVRLLPLPGFVRVSTGTQAENQKFLEILSDFQASLDNQNK